MGGEGQPLQDGYGQRAVSEEGLWKQRKPVVFGRWVWRGSRMRSVGVRRPWTWIPSPSPPTHTVVMTFREPDLKRRIFFFSACDALIFTKTLAGPAGVATPAAPPGPDGEAPAAATSC